MTQQFYHEFKGYGIHPSRCLVKIFSDDGEHFICFEDINDGTSVTNASEMLAQSIVSKMKFDPDDCRFFETYSQNIYLDSPDLEEIEYTWALLKLGELDMWTPKHPKWKPASNEIKKLFI